MKGFELYQKLKLDISPIDLDIILYHSSYQPQDPIVRKTNKEYVIYGKQIISSMIAIYTYVNNICVSATDLTKITSSCYQSVIDMIYERYNLEDYIYIANGEVGRRHADVGAKLVAVYYKENGFLDTYEFIVPYVKEAVATNHSYDYKTILQEYAHTKKLNIKYEYIDVEGPDNACIFTCKLIVGNESVIAKATSKKLASKNAAQKYIESRRVPLKSDIVNHEMHLFDQVYVSKERKKQFEQILCNWGLSSDVIQLEQLSAAFTHKSIIQEIKNIKIVDNSAISVIGSELINLFVIDYLYKLPEHGEFEISREKAYYIKAESLREVLPDAWLNLLIGSKSIRSLNRAGLGNIKIDIFYSIVAVLTLNAVKNIDKDLIDRTTNIAEVYFHKTKEYKVPDYTTCLQAVVQFLEYTWGYECDQVVGSLNHSPLYEAIVAYDDNMCTVKKYGIGTNKKKAINDASKKLLKHIFENSDNEIAKEMIQKVLDYSDL